MNEWREGERTDLKGPPKDPVKNHVFDICLLSSCHTSQCFTVLSTSKVSSICLGSFKDNFDSP